MSTTLLSQNKKAHAIWRSLKWIFPGLPALPDDNIVTPLTRSEFLDLVKTMFAAITFVSVFIAVSTFSLQERALTKEYEWRHKKEAQDILQTWDSRTSMQKAKIESFFRRRYRSEHMVPITEEDAVAIRKARAPLGWNPASVPKDAEEELWDVRVKLTELLNYFETVSTACLQDIANESILRESLGGAMRDWRRYLQNYTAIANQQSGREIWKPYRELMFRWNGSESGRAITHEPRPWPNRGR